jgi:hypothetical protein
MKLLLSVLLIVTLLVGVIPAINARPYPKHNSAIEDDFLQEIDELTMEGWVFDDYVADDDVPSNITIPIQFNMSTIYVRNLNSQPPAINKSHEPLPLQGDADQLPSCSCNCSAQAKNVNKTYYILDMVWD